jgi:hypothetical protein
MCQEACSSQLLNYDNARSSPLVLAKHLVSSDQIVIGTELSHDVLNPLTYHVTRQQPNPYSHYSCRCDEPTSRCQTILRSKSRRNHHLLSPSTFYSLAILSSTANIGSLGPHSYIKLTQYTNIPKVLSYKQSIKH